MFDYSLAKRPELAERGIIWGLVGTFSALTLLPCAAVLVYMLIGAPMLPLWMIISASVIWFAATMGCFCRGIYLIGEAYRR